MAQFHMRYSLSLSLCPSSSNVSQSFFFCTVIFMFAKRRRRLGWLLWWRVKLTDRSQRHLLLLITTQGKDFYLTFLIPETPLARLHFTPAHRHKCVCVCVCTHCLGIHDTACQGTRNGINLVCFCDGWLVAVKIFRVQINTGLYYSLCKRVKSLLMKFDLK
jgi:hypothetical protein